MDDGLVYDMFSGKLPKVALFLAGTDKVKKIRGILRGFREVWYFQNAMKAGVLLDR
jgi:hypothetical protein